MSKLRPPVQCHVDDPIGRALKRGPDAALRALREAERGAAEKAAKVESPLEAAFLALWLEDGGSAAWSITREYRFHPKRRFRFDFAFPAFKVAVELDGMKHHGNFKAWRKDAEKRNLATLMGWRVLTYTAKDLKERPEEVVEEVKSLLERTQ